MYEWAVGAADDGDSAGLVGHEAEGEGHHIGAEDAELRGCAYKHQFRIGYQGGEVSHGTDAKEYQRRIPPCAHAIIKDIEHGALLVDADFKAGGSVEWYVADEYAEADRHQKHRLEILCDCEPYEE